MKKQEKNTDTKKNLSKTEKMAATIERLRNENHNLKRQLKRCKSKLEEKSEAENAVSNKTGNISKTDEVKTESLEEIKKKLQTQGLTEKEMEVTLWFMSRAIDFTRK